MARIAICEHMDDRDVEAFRIILEARGHVVLTVSNPDPAQAVKDIQAFGPDVVVMDLMFEGVDNDKPPADWWGCNIIRLLSANADTADLPVVARSRFLGAEVRDVVEGLGVPSDQIVGQFDMNIKEVAILIETLV